jgi:LPS-assembly protein
VQPPELPQFDYESPSLRLLPLEFPDYNSIDSIDSQNVIRWGLRNKLQTKRAGKVANLVDWDLYTDWRLKPRSDQETFADLYSDLVLRPRSWLSLESLTRWDIHSGEWRMAFNTLSIHPNDVWSWRIGYYYLRDDVPPPPTVLVPPPTALGLGNSILNSTMSYKLNENWAFRMSHYYDARAGSLREQSYTVFRDLRSWTAALSFLIRNDQPGSPEDFTVAFTFSLKAYPRYPLGSDTGGPSSLLGM